ncbi:MAG TPA: IclR family transcriptional regulator [Dongiaceae bacterium]|nr:IclR family transcriptional regulator [Dongiaceae bacterium]
MPRTTSSAPKKRNTRTSGAVSRATGTLGKLLEVLQAIADADRPPRFTDLLESIAQPRGTLHRHVRHLVAEGLVIGGGDRPYELGPRFLRLAAQSWSKNRFRSLAEPFLREVHENSGETIHLGLLNGTEVIYVDKIESRQAVRMHSQVGRASPAYCTGIGKAALSTLAAADLKQVVSQFHFVRYTPNTIQTQAALLKEIDRIRRSGIAEDREEHELGIRCVAAPIAGPHGRFAAGLSVTAPAYRVGRREIAHWSKWVRKAAQAIELALDSGLGPRDS